MMKAVSCFLELQKHGHLYPTLWNFGLNCPRRASLTITGIIQLESEQRFSHVTADGKTAALAARTINMNFTKSVVR